MTRVRVRVMVRMRGSPGQRGAWIRVVTRVRVRVLGKEELGRMRDCLECSKKELLGFRDLRMRGLRLQTKELLGFRDLPPWHGRVRMRGLRLQAKD